MSSKTTCMPPISDLEFSFVLEKDQLEAIDAWLENGYRGSVIYIAQELEKPGLPLNVQDALRVC
ncbi:MAG TPA: hypothetical protein VE244_03440 [Nitrososphaeraceae archaeon]|nr:hypothetical protein [Nitrososphaeraceae archaeon]